jgi:protein-S-isoprenylcysteine O-methyltransferase Ste14
MYASILVLLVGWSVAFGSPLMLLYAVAVAVAFHLRVTMYEEPTLARQFGADWNAYSCSTPRWLRWPKI